VLSAPSAVQSPFPASQGRFGGPGGASASASDGSAGSGHASASASDGSAGASHASASASGASSSAGGASAGAGDPSADASDASVGAGDASRGPSDASPGAGDGRPPADRGVFFENQGIYPMASRAGRGSECGLVWRAGNSLGHT
jgi:hypothetical protein